MEYISVKRHSGATSPPVNSGSGNFKVAVRVRPLIDREIRELAQECVCVDMIHKAVIITKVETTKSKNTIEIDDFSDHIRQETTPQNQNFFFDLVFDPSTTQQSIYESCAQHIVMSVLQGYNGSIIAYGQTSTGKSYTIEGGDNETTKGIIPRASEEIFTYIKTKASVKDRFLVRVSFLEIYNERLTDLLDPLKDNLRIREDGTGGVYVENLSEHVVRSTDEITKLIHNGAAKRKTAATRMNVESSRSHAVFTIILEHAEYSTGGGSVVTIGKLRLVDLAGSEKLDSDAKLQQQTETKNINVSLHTFGKVVMTLTSAGTVGHVPYRDSKLTRILQDSLGGNCKTSLITTITPVTSCYMESLNSLKFAKRAKHVKNNAVINKDVSQKALLSAYQDEIRKLREQLDSKGMSVDKEKLEMLEKEKKTAQMEKDEVLSELERQRKLYLEAEEEKKRLLKQIDGMETMFLHGGNNDIQKAIEEEREKILNEAEIEYSKKLAQLEEEKKRLANEKEEIERQKEYFAKMRVDFKPEGQNNDEKSVTEKVVRRKSSLPSRPTPTGASLPHPPFGNLPRRAPIIRSRGLMQSWGHYPSTGVFSHGINEALYHYTQALADPFTGIPSQELQSGTRIFTGVDGANWFMKNMEGVSTIEEAEVIGQRLIQLGMISEIQGGDHFVARSDAYYQFTEQSTATVSPYDTRPNSALSMMTLPTAGGHSGLLLPQQRAGSLPTVYPQLSQSCGLYSRSSSISTLNGVLSGTELLDQYNLTQCNPSALHTASINNDREKVKELVSKIPVDIVDNKGNTPLIYAAIAGQTKCCSLLVKQFSANLNITNDDGQSPVMLAALHEHHDTVKLLLKCGAQTDTTDNNNETIYHIAARNNDSKTLETIFKYSTSKAINERNNSIQSPLHVAVLADKPHNITVLLHGNADIGACDSEGRTALHYAVQYKALNCLQSIVTNSPNGVNLVDLNGCSALHLACQEGNHTAVNALLQSKKCDINLTDKTGYTPLHYAVLANNAQIVHILLSNGADSNIRDKSKMTPLQYSREMKLKDCTDLLLKYM